MNVEEFNEHAPYGLEHRRALAEDYRIKHRWHLHLELPAHELTEDQRKSIRDIIDGESPCEQTSFYE